MTGYTTTGQVFQHKTKLIGDAERSGELPVRIGRPLSNHLDTALERVERWKALKALVRLLHMQHHDPDKPMATWNYALKIAELITRFKQAGYQRVKAGGRAANEMDGYLFTMIEIDGAKTANGLHPEIKEILIELD